MRGAQSGAPRLPQSTFSIETFILGAAGPVPAPPQAAAPSRDAGTAVDTAVAESLPSAFPGKTHTSVLALTIRLKLQIIPNT